MAERRSTVRAVVRIEVYDQDSRVERVPLFISGNVSSGGLFLITREPYPLKTSLKIEFSLPGEGPPIKALGSIVWTRTDKQAPGQQPGMGVQFMEIEEKDRDRVRKFVYAQSEFEQEN